MNLSHLTQVAQISGLSEVMKNLQKVDKQFNSKVILPAVRKGLVPIQRQAKANCNHASLKKLIGKKAFINKKKEVSGKVYMLPSKDRTIKLQGRDVGFEVVANILEFGRKRGDLKPEPFMRPARDTAMPAAYKAMEEEAKKRLAKL